MDTWGAGRQVIVGSAQGGAAPKQIIAPVLMIGSRFDESGENMSVYSGRRRPAVHRQTSFHTDVHMCSVLTDVEKVVKHIETQNKKHETKK